MLGFLHSAPRSHFLLQCSLVKSICLHPGMNDQSVKLLPGYVIDPTSLLHCAAPCWRGGNTEALLYHHTAISLETLWLQLCSSAGLSFTRMPVAFQSGKEKCFQRKKLLQHPRKYLTQHKIHIDLHVFCSGVLASVKTTLCYCSFS